MIHYINKISFLVFWLISSLTFAQKNPLSLKTALQTALVNNLEIKVGSFELAKGLQDIAQTKLRPNPIFNTQILFLKEQHYFPDYPLFTSQFNRQDWYQVTKKYQLFGQRKNNIQLAYSQQVLVGLSFEESKRQLLYIVATKWLEAWYAQIQMELAKEAVASLDTLVEKSKPNNDTELPNEYLRLLVLDDEYDMVEINATQELDNQISNLKYIIQNDSIESIDTVNNFKLGEEQDLETCLTIGLVNRPDLLLTTQSLLNANENVKLQNSLSWPAPEAGLVFNPQNKIPYLGIFLTQSIPVFDYNQTKLAKAKIVVDQTGIQIKLMQQKVKNEIQIAYKTLETQKLKLEKMTKAVQNANKLLSQVRQRYTKNRTVYVDLWEAESTWYDTQTIYFKTAYELRKSYLDLLFVTGKLLTWTQ